MKIEYKIETNPHATKADEYIIVASSVDYPNYSYASFFDLSDRDIGIEWFDWGSLDYSECSERYIENFNSSIHDGDAILLAEQFVDDTAADQAH
tara:strand:- start:65 stop:346 length:282 start_codon:yes stop_codon:yes gene_type:complete